VQPPPVLKESFSAEVLDAYRTLGITSDATYQEIELLVEEMERIYSNEPKKLAAIEKARNIIVDNLMSKRMAGSMKGPTDLMDIKPKSKPIWSRLDFSILKKLTMLIEFPSFPHLRNVVGLLGGLAVASWLSPQQAGGLLMLNTMSAAGFMYNRGEGPEVRDDKGQIGEIKPTKTKPLLLTVAIIAACYFWGVNKAKAMVTRRGFEVCMRMTMVSCALILPCLFVKVHPIFD
jgi:hypothetical protein